MAARIVEVLIDDPLWTASWLADVAKKGDKGSGNALGVGQPEGPGDLVMKSLSIAILLFGKHN